MRNAVSNASSESACTALDPWAKVHSVKGRTPLPAKRIAFSFHRVSSSLSGSHSCHMIAIGKAWYRSREIRFCIRSWMLSRSNRTDEARCSKYSRSLKCNRKIHFSKIWMLKQTKCWTSSSITKFKSKWATTTLAVPKSQTPTLAAASTR